MAGQQELKWEHIDSDNEHYWSDGIGLYNKDRTVLIKVNDVQSYEIPEGVLEIGPRAFADACESIEQVNLPESLVKISRQAFYPCKHIKELYIPKNVSEIADDAFCNDAVYRSFYSLGKYEYPSELQKIQVHPDNKFFKDEDGVLFSRDGSYLILYPISKPDKEYIIPIGTEKIGRMGFYANQCLESLELPNTIKEFIDSLPYGRGTFEGCKCLKHLSVCSEKLPDYAFKNCTQLNEVVFSDNVKEIGFFAFNNSGMENIVLPRYLEKMSESVFDGKFEEAKLKKIIIYDSVKCPDIGKAVGLYRNDYIIEVKDSVTDNLKSKVFMCGNGEPEKITEMLSSSWKTKGEFDYAQIDLMFKEYKVLWHRAQTARFRLEYPIDLSDENKKMYSDFMARNGLKIITKLVEDKNTEDIRCYIELGALTKNNYDKVFSLISEINDTELKAWFLDYANNNSVGKTAGKKKTVKNLNLNDKIPELWDTKKDNIGLLGRYRGNESKVSFPANYKDIEITGTYDLNGKTPDNYVQITEVIIPEGYTSLGKNTFKDCINLVKVSLPSTLEMIGEHCFENCKSIKELALPKNVIKVKKDAFKGCTSLKQIILSENLEYLGDGAFSGCYGLSEIDLGEKVKYLGSNCFTETGLNKVVFRGKSCFCPEHMCFWYPRYVYTDGKIDALGIPASTHMPLSYLGIETDEIAKTALGELLKNITICTSGTLKAFPKNTDLRFKSISFEDFVERFGGTYSKTYSKKVDLVVTFKIDTNNSTVQKAIANGSAVIEERVFLECMRKGEFSLSDYKVDIAVQETVAKKKPDKNDPFSPSQIKKTWGFSYNEDGTVTLTDYKGTDTEIIIPERVGESPVTCLGDSIFSPMKERRKQDRCAFMKTIRSVVIPDGVKHIGKKSFYGCESLNFLSIPEGVTSLEFSAFSDCTSLEKIVLPNSIEIICHSAFYDCKKLKSINVKAEVKMEEGAFTGCDSLADKDGFIIINDVLFGYSGVSTLIKIPHGVKSIRCAYSPWGDANWLQLEEVEIPDTVEEIGANAFNRCRQLKMITIPETIRAIGEEAFHDCELLRDTDGFVIINGILNWYLGDKKELFIPDDVREISGMALLDYRNSKLKIIHIPDSVEMIGRLAISAGTTVVSKTGSVAEEYAKNNNLAFKEEK